MQPFLLVTWHKQTLEFTNRTQIETHWEGFPLLHLFFISIFIEQPRIVADFHSQMRTWNAMQVRERGRETDRDSATADCVDWLIATHSVYTVYTVCAVSLCALLIWQLQRVIFASSSIPPSLRLSMPVFCGFCLYYRWEIPCRRRLCRVDFICTYLINCILSLKFIYIKEFKFSLYMPFWNHYTAYIPSKLQHFHRETCSEYRECFTLVFFHLDFITYWLIITN